MPPRRSLPLPEPILAAVRVAALGAPSTAWLHLAIPCPTPHCRGYLHVRRVPRPPSAQYLCPECKLAGRPAFAKESADARSPLLGGLPSRTHRDAVVLAIAPDEWWALGPARVYVRALATAPLVERDGTDVVEIVSNDAQLERLANLVRLEVKDATDPTLLASLNALDQRLAEFRRSRQPAGFAELSARAAAVTLRITLHRKNRALPVWRRIEVPAVWSFRLLCRRVRALFGWWGEGTVFTSGLASDEGMEGRTQDAEDQLERVARLRDHALERRHFILVGGGSFEWELRCAVEDARDAGGSLPEDCPPRALDGAGTIPLESVWSRRWFGCTPAPWDRDAATTALRGEAIPPPVAPPEPLTEAILGWVEALPTTLRDELTASIFLHAGYAPAERLRDAVLRVLATRRRPGNRIRREVAVIRTLAAAIDACSSVGSPASLDRPTSGVIDLAPARRAAELAKWKALRESELRDAQIEEWQSQAFRAGHEAQTAYDAACDKGDFGEDASPD